MIDSIKRIILLHDLKHALAFADYDKLNLHFLESLRREVEAQLRKGSAKKIKKKHRASIVIPDEEIKVYKFPHTIILTSDEKPKVKDGRDHISSASEFSP